MSNYTQTTTFATKDALTTGDPNKKIQGATVDVEFSAISTAITSKLNTSDLAGTLAVAGNLTFSGTNIFNNSNTFTGTFVAPTSGLTGTHTLPDGVLSTNVPLINASNIFTGVTQTINGSNALLKVTDGTREVRLNAEPTKGSVGTQSNHPFSIFTNGSTVLSLDAAGTLAGSTIASVAFSDFARLSQTNTFTVSPQTIAIAGNATLVLNNTLNTANDQAYLTLNTNGLPRAFIGVGSLVTGGTRADITLRAQAGGLYFTGDGASTIAFALSSAGVLTTPGASSGEVGTAGVVQNSQSADYTLVLTDRNKNLHQTGASKTFTIPANGSVAYPIGTVLNFTTDNATGVSIAITTDTLRLAGTSTTGTRTLAQYGMATAEKILSTTWLISGAGLS